MPKNRPESASEGGAAKKAKPAAAVSWAEQSPAERKSSLEVISAKLKELDLRHIKVKAETSLLAQAENAGSLLENHILRLDGIHSPSQSAKVAEFAAFIETVVPGADDSSYSGLCVGETVPATRAFSASNTEVPLTFGGQVVLLVFWTPTDISEIRHVRKIAEEHKDWVGKARIVCISLADESQQGEDLPDMPLVKQLYNGKEAAVTLGIYPEETEYILVDAAGVIAKRGTSADFNVTQDVTACIAKQKLGTEEKKLQEGQWASFSDADRRALLTRMSQIIKDSGLKTLGLRSDSNFTYTFEGGPIGNEDARLVLDGVLLQSQEPAMVQLINELHQAKVLDVEYEFTTLFKILEDEGDDEGDDDRTPVIPTQCQECKASLEGAKSRYLCACCPAPYYAICEACEGRRSTSTHAPYHVMFVVPAAGWNEEVHFSVGDLTTWPVFADAIGTPDAEVRCDGCSKVLGDGARMECAQCNDHDLCIECWKKQKPDDPHSSHVWIKIHDPRGCRLTVSPEENDPFGIMDEGDFGEEDDEEAEEGADDRIQLQ